MGDSFFSPAEVKATVEKDHVQREKKFEALHLKVSTVLPLVEGAAATVVAAAEAAVTSNQ